MHARSRVGGTKCLKFCAGAADASGVLPTSDEYLFDGDLLVTSPREPAANGRGGAPPRAEGGTPPPPPPAAGGAEPEPVLDRVLRILRVRKWTLMQAVVVVFVATLAFTLHQSKVYSASASLLFQDSSDPALIGDTTSGATVVDPTRAAATNQSLVSLPVIAQRTAATLGGRVSAGDVQSNVTVGDTSAESDVVKITADAATPALAADLANAYGKAYIAFRRSVDRSRLSSGISLLQSTLAALPAGQRTGPQAASLTSRLQRLRLAQSLQTGDANLVQPATPPTSASSPQVKRNLVLGLVVGVVLGFGLAALRDRLDQRIKDEDELERIFGLPILTRVPRSAKVPRLAGESSALEGREAEIFRMLRANLHFVNLDNDARTTLIASPMPGDGKSTVARNLAMTMAAMGDRVVLVDADMHRPGASGPEGYETGLSTVLAGGSLEEALVRLPTSPDEQESNKELVLLPSGPMPPNPSRLLESERMIGVLDGLSNTFDHVIVDSPALSVVSDGLSLVPLVSGVVVVIGLGHTTRDVATDVRNQLGLLNARSLGLVVNFVANERKAYHDYYGTGRGRGSRSRRRTGPSSVAPSAPDRSDEPQPSLPS
jgi:tyrosine-protein kinase